MVCATCNFNSISRIAVTELQVKLYRAQIIIAVQVGDAEECASGTSVVGAAGEEAAQSTTSRCLPTLPHHGNKPKASR